MLGLASYEATWQAMRDFTNTRDASTPDQLWVCEHPPVYTLGQAGKREHLIKPTDIPLVHTDRGGQITYHGPGQVVAYPLIDLRRAGFYVKDYVWRLEESIVDCLAEYGLAALRKPNAPGVYVKLGDEWAKVAALGLKVRGGCVYHGAACNICMDLSPFEAINPCGYAGLRTLDLAGLGIQTTLAEFTERWLTHLQRRLGPND